jgi:hypothetical protein
MLFQGRFPIDNRGVSMKVTHLLTCAALLSQTCAFAASKTTPPPAQEPPPPLSKTHFFIDASFNYWYAGEEGLKIASTGVFNEGTGEFYYAHKTKGLYQSFDYKPGFKVGAGVVGVDDWTLLAEYTWFRGSHTKHSTALTSSAVLTAGTVAALDGAEVWVVDDWFLQGTGQAQAIAGSSVSSKWRLALDLADVVVSRPFHQGRSVTFSPFAGLRGARIRQSMTVKLTEAAVLFDDIALPSDSVPTQPITSRNHSHSWAIGPRVGVDGRFSLPMEFRIEANVGASLLYTRYTSINHREDSASTQFNPGPYSANIQNYNCLRPEADVGLGFGWGKDLYDQTYHIDFSADYNFMIFWAQNMMRQSLDSTLAGTGSEAANLYLHGLTLTFRFDF